MKGAKRESSPAFGGLVIAAAAIVSAAYAMGDGGRLAALASGLAGHSIAGLADLLQAAAQALQQWT